LHFLPLAGPGRRTFGRRGAARISGEIAAALYGRPAVEVIHFKKA
jgi:hypothetical protein